MCSSDLNLPVLTELAVDVAADQCKRVCQGPWKHMSKRFLLHRIHIDRTGIPIRMRVQDSPPVDPYSAMPRRTRFYHAVTIALITLDSTVLQRFVKTCRSFRLVRSQRPWRRCHHNHCRRSGRQMPQKCSSRHVRRPCRFVKGQSIKIITHRTDYYTCFTCRHPAADPPAG